MTIHLWSFIGGSSFAGIVVGLFPLLLGRLNEQTRLGWAGFSSSLIGSILGGVLIALLPAGFFTYLISARVNSPIRFYVDKSVVLLIGACILTGGSLVIVAGLLPLLFGKLNNQTRLGWSGFGACLIGAVIGGSLIGEGGIVFSFLIAGFFTFSIYWIVIMDRNDFNNPRKAHPMPR